MRVVCDSCGASYKIPDSKLTKEVNKATCRKCGHAIFIRRAGEEDPKPVSAAPAPQNEERTLITSAADLERQVRARAGAGFDESADQRPTTVSLDNGPAEATVPREPAPPAALAAPAAFPPPPAAPFAPAAGPAPFVPAAATPAFPNASPAAFPPPPAPFAPAAAAPPAPARPAPISPSAEAPPAFARPPEPVRSAPAAPVVAAANVGAANLAAACHDPRTDLSMALVALFVTALGVLVLAVSSVLANPVIAGLGAFLALLGTFVVAFILLTGGRGTKPASLVVSFVGGFFLSGAVAAALSGALFALAPGAAPTEPPVAATPPAEPPAAPTPPAEPAAPPPADPAAALADAAPPAEPPPAEPPAAPAPVAAAPPPAPAPTPTPAPAATASKPATTSTTSTATKTPTSSSKPSSSSSDAPVRIQPTSTASSSSSSSKSSTSSSSGSSSKPASTSSSSSTSGASTASATKSTGVSAVVIDTMIKSNKGVKSCFVTQRNETGDLPRGVKVKLTIQSSGKVSSASIPSGEWAGTSFDDCLSGAVRSIQFPPFEGDPVTVTYPFSI